MWCIFCEQPICHKEKSTAKRHVAIPQHKKAKHDFPKLVKTPGLSAPVEPKSEGSEVSMWQPLNSKWDRYTRIEKVTVSCAADIVAFWESQDPILADAIMLYLWFPITATYIERTFSLAGLIDAKNRQKMSSSLRKAAVGIYCNGIMECRFMEP